MWTNRPKQSQVVSKVLKRVTEGATSIGRRLILKWTESKVTWVFKVKLNISWWGEENKKLTKRTILQRFKVD